MNTKKLFILVLASVVLAAVAVSGTVFADVVGIPVLLSPAHGSTTGDTTPDFTWQVASGADSYTFELKKVSDNSVVAKNTYDAAARCDASTCTIPSPLTLDPDAYKWHVVAYNGAIMGTWSTYSTFTVADFSLDTPILRSPGANAIVYGGRPTFKWYPVENATRYNVQMMNGSGTVLDTWNTTGTDCAPYWCFRIPYDLASNYGDYQWRVQALDGAALSDWSVTRTFTYTQLARTWLISPSDGYSTQDGSPLVEWGDITGATMYLVQVRRASTDALIIQHLVSDADFCDGSTCGWEIDPGLADDSYIWHVRAKNGRNFGRWTAYRDLIIEPADYFYGFGSETSDWIDPDNTWSVINGIYTGTHGTCDYSCATTYLNLVFTDGMMNTFMRTSGAQPGTGFSLYYRAQFDGSGNLVQAYTVDVVSFAQNTITFRFWKYSPTLGWQTIPGEDEVTIAGNISAYNIYSINVNGSTMSMRFTAQGATSSVAVGTVTNLDPAYSSGLFAVDVISYEDTSHIVEVDWVQVYDADYSSASAALPQFMPAAGQVNTLTAVTGKEAALPASMELFLPGE
ncbi:MAG: hypothetical protein HPY85_15565 [Anaerolineae bacterium]|nr:hypothetical protein [Anaerolineae bacterium]